MSRYDLLLKRSPKIASETESIEFGFNEELDIKDRKYNFYLKPGEKAHVSLVFTDPKVLFMAARAHYYGNNRFLCKSTSQRKAACCSFIYPGQKPVLRIATIVYVSPNTLRRFSHETPVVLPWVFGKAVYNRLKALHEHLDLSKYDFMVWHENGDVSREKFSCKYRVTAVPESTPEITLSWKHRLDRENILERAAQLSKNIKSYIGENLEEHIIRDILERPRSDILPVPEQRPRPRREPIMDMWGTDNLRPVQSYDLNNNNQFENFLDDLTENP